MIAQRVGVAAMRRGAFSIPFDTLAGGARRRNAQRTGQKAKLVMGLLLVVRLVVTLLSNAGAIG